MQTRGQGGPHFFTTQKLKDNIMTLKIANSYGDFDKTKNQVPRGYTFLAGTRLSLLCRKHKIRFLRAITSWNVSSWGSKPTFGGVVVTTKQAPKLLAAISERDKKAQDPKVITARAKAKQKRREQIAKDNLEHDQRCDTVGIASGSRTASWLKLGYVDDDEAELIGFKTAYRHEYTDYDDLLERGYDGQMARDCKEEREPIPSTWQEYLDHYGFKSPEAQALASTLKDPLKCHAIWFKEAELAIKRGKLPLEGLTYAAIANAIADWRSERSDD